MGVQNVSKRFKCYLVLNIACRGCSQLSQGTKILQKCLLKLEESGYVFYDRQREKHEVDFRFLQDPYESDFRPPEVPMVPKILSS